MSELSPVSAVNVVVSPRRHTLAWGLLAVLAACRPTPQNPQTHKPVAPPLPDSECARHLERVELMAERAMPRAVGPEVQKLAQVAARDREGSPDCHRRVRSFLAELTTSFVDAYASGNREYYEPSLELLNARSLLESGAEVRAQVELSLGQLEYARATDRFQAAAAYDPGDRLTEARERDRQALTHFRNALSGPLPPDGRYRASLGQLAVLDRTFELETDIFAIGFDELACVYDQLGDCTGPSRYTPQYQTSDPAVRPLLAAHQTFGSFAYTKKTAAEQVHWRLRKIQLLTRLGQRDAVGQEFSELRKLDLPPPQRAAVAAAYLDYVLLQWLRPRAQHNFKTLEQATVEARRAKVDSHPRIQWAELLVRVEQAHSQKQAAEASRSFVDFRACAERYSQLYNGQQAVNPTVALKPVHQLEFLSEAISCYRDAGLAGQMARLAEHMRIQHPSAANLPQTMVDVGQTLEQMLLFEQARSWYEKFLSQFSRHPKAPLVRRHLVWTSVLLGASVEQELAQLRRGDRNARRFASAIAFRTLRTGRDSSPEALERYLQAVDPRDDRLRTALAHTYLARVYFESSCPVASQAGPCVELTREKSLGQAVARDPATLALALKHLESARAAMDQRGWSDDPFGASFGAPLQVQLHEVSEARAIVELISGDSLAEKALFTRPPYSREPARTRRWLELRKRQLEQMVATYRRIQTPRYAATVAARQGLIYEADGGLLSDVALDLRRANQTAASELANQLEELANRRYEQAREAYNRCLDQVQTWGQDRENRAGVCRARLGQLLGQFDEPRVYAPNPMDPLLLGPN